MNFIYLETTIGPIWIRANEIAGIIPESENSCEILTRMSQINIYGIIKVRHESADELLHRLDNGIKTRAIPCPTCPPNHQFFVSVLDPICTECKRKGVISSTTNPVQKLPQQIPPPKLPRP